MLKKIFALLRETATAWSDHNASSLAAAVAFYTLISLAPVLLIAVAVAGVVFGEQAARGELLQQISGLVGNDAAKVIESAVENAGRHQRTGIVASVVNLAVLIFGATNVFAELQDALNTMWGVKPKAMRAQETVWNYVRKRILSFAMVLVIAFLLLVSLVLSAALSGLTDALPHLAPAVGFFSQPVNFVVSLAAVTLLFAMIYKILPDATVRWRDTWIGAGITAVLFSSGKLLIGLYLGNASFASVYGAAGALVVTVMWVYYSAQILFFGAELTQVYARQHGVVIEPDEHAVRVEVIEREIDGAAEQHAGGAQPSSDSSVHLH